MIIFKYYDTRSYEEKVFTLTKDLGGDPYKICGYLFAPVEEIHAPLLYWFNKDPGLALPAAVSLCR